MTITFHVGKPLDPTKEGRWTAGGTGNRLTGAGGKPAGIRVELWCGGPDGAGREDHFNLDGDSVEMKRFLEAALRVVLATERLIEQREGNSDVAR